jgi:hypothetical protein
MDFQRPQTDLALQLIDRVHLGKLASVVGISSVLVAEARIGVEQRCLHRVQHLGFMLEVPRDQRQFACRQGLVTPALGRNTHLHCAATRQLRAAGTVGACARLETGTGREFRSGRPPGVILESQTRHLHGVAAVR